MVQASTSKRRNRKRAYGGFYLAPPKSGSVGDVDLDDQVALMLADRLREFPPVTVTERRRSVVGAVLAEASSKRAWSSTGS